MTWKTDIAGITANALECDTFESDIEWRQVVLNDGIALVPNKPLMKMASFSWMAERLLPLMNGGIIKIENRYYRVGIPRTDDIHAIREVIDPNTTFWVKSVTPRKCHLGPRRGKYVRVADEYEGGIDLLPVLYEITTAKQKAKAIAGGWKRAIMGVLAKVKRRVGEFASKLGLFCKGLKREHVRRAHWREVTKGVFVWVKECVVRTHYYGDVLIGGNRF